MSQCRVFLYFQSGELINVFGSMSYRPDELRAFMNYYEIIMAKRGKTRKFEIYLAIFGFIVANVFKRNQFYQRNCLPCHSGVGREGCSREPAHFVTIRPVRSSIAPFVEAI